MHHSLTRLRASVVSCAVAFGLFGTGSASAGVTPLGTAFTYQGLLKSGGSPANGTFHLRFQLWNALAGGAQLGSDLNFPTLSISDGRFTAALDFGSNVFDGSARWLQVQVVTGGGTVVTTLTPRQPITAAPYALQTRGIFVDSTNNVGIGTAAPFTRLHLLGTGASVTLQDTASVANQAGYVSFRNSAGTETAWMGFGTAGSPKLTVLNNRSSGDIVLTPGAGGRTHLIHEVKIGGPPKMGFSELFLIDNVGENWGTILRVENNAGSQVFRVDNNGSVVVAGNLSKGGGSFKIDHPLDPADKYLSHSFVESPDMMNIYNGNIVTDAKGNAVVTLPDWFGALNRDFRYQLTVIGQFAQAIISQEISNNQFSIQTDKPDIKVSWQVTGIRQDAYANAHRILVEELKAENERGLYLHPDLFAQPEEKGLNGRAARR